MKREVVDKEKFQRLYAEWEKGIPDPATKTYEDAKAHADKLRMIWAECRTEVEDELEGQEEK